MVGLAGLGVERGVGSSLSRLVFRTLDLGLRSNTSVKSFGGLCAWFFGKTLEARYEDSSSGT